MNNVLEVEIKDVKSIKDFNIKIPFRPGLYAITGENGIGKSTIFNVLSKLVYRAAFQKFLKNDGSSNSKITFRLNGVENIWEKPLNWQRANTDTPEIYMDGFFEGSLIFGSRFADAHTSRLSRTLSIKGNDVCPAHSFVIENLGSILRNNKLYYSGLKKVKSKNIAAGYGFNGIPYLFEKNGRWIHQFNMSSGEFLLIGLLHFVHERITYKKKRQNTQISLIIIDEIELALHPAAQARLADFLNRISKEFDFCTYFATHSIQIINKVKPDSLFHVESGIDGTLEVLNPCYAAYATRSLYTPDGYDFLLLVEDELAQHLVEKSLRDKQLDNGRLIKVLPCGGWEKILELQSEIISSHLAGSNCKTISILDGDIRLQYEEKYKGTQFDMMPKAFLAIESVEKYLKKRLVTDPDNLFGRRFGDTFFRVRSLADILEDYKSDEKSQKDKNGKGLFMVLKSCAGEQSQDPQVFKKDVCEFIAQYEDSDKLNNALERLCART